MKIEEAVEALEDGKTISSANARATIKPKQVEGQWRVTITSKTVKGKDDIMDMTLSRMKQLYKLHDFALGSFKEPAQPADRQTKQAEPEVIK